MPISNPSQSTPIWDTMHSWPSLNRFVRFLLMHSSGPWWLCRLVQRDFWFGLQCFWYFVSRLVHFDRSNWMKQTIKLSQLTGTTFTHQSQQARSALFQGEFCIANRDVGVEWSVGISDAASLIRCILNEANGWTGSQIQSIDLESRGENVHGWDEPSSTCECLAFNFWGLQECIADCVSQLFDCILKVLFYGRLWSCAINRVVVCWRSFCVRICELWPLGKWGKHTKGFKDCRSMTHHVCHSILDVCFEWANLSLNHKFNRWKSSVDISDYSVGELLICRLRVD